MGNELKINKADNNFNVDHQKKSFIILIHNKLWIWTDPMNRWRISRATHHNPHSIVFFLVYCLTTHAVPLWSRADVIVRHSDSPSSFWVTTHIHTHTDTHPCPPLLANLSKECTSFTLKTSHTDSLLMDAACQGIGHKSAGGLSRLSTMRQIACEIYTAVLDCIEAVMQGCKYTDT